MVVFISSFQLYFIDTHIYLSLNVPHWLKSEKRFFVVLIINVPQSNVNYITNLTISQITNNACLALIKHLYVKRISMYMNKRTEFGETFVYFSQMKRYLRLSK